SPEQAVCQCLAPPFHLAELQIRREPERLYKATEHRQPPTSSTCCSFVTPIAPRRRSVADRSAAPHLVYGPRCFCPMVTRPRQFRPRNFQPWSFLGTVCQNAVTPTPPRMALIHHANC